MATEQILSPIQVADLYRLRAILEVMKKNLFLINEVPNAQIVWVGGGNLYDLALKYYGDATQWNYIAVANNLVDPELPITVKPIQLLIPPKPANQSGGVYNAP